MFYKDTGSKKWLFGKKIRGLGRSGENSRLTPEEFIDNAHRITDNLEEKGDFMGRYRKYVQWGQMAKVPLASGGTMEFYEPDQLLSDQLNTKKMLTQEIAIRETAWN